MSGDVFQCGWLDTTLFVHPLFANDPHRERCLEILQALERGEAQGRLDPVVAHELTYVLPRCSPEFQRREEVLSYILHFLSLETVLVENKELLIETLQIWVQSGVGFADARLLALARAEELPVCSVNERDFRGFQNSFVAWSLPRE